MNYFSLRLFIILLVTAIINFGCAAPSARLEQQTFIDPIELDVVDYNTQGLRLASSGRLIDAEIAFRKALFLSPNTIPVRLNLAITLRELEQFEESEKFFNIILNEQPLNLTAIAGLAVLYFQDQRPLLGEQWLNRAIKLSIDKEDWVGAAKYSGMQAEAWYKKGDFQKARCSSEYALNLNYTAQGASAYVRLLLEDGDFERAYKILNGGGIQVAQNASLRIQLALATFARGELEDAANQLERLELGIKKTPEHTIEVQALRILTRLIAENGDMEAPLNFAELQEDELKKLDVSGAALSVGGHKLRSWPWQLRDKLEEYLEWAGENENG